MPRPDFPKTLREFRQKFASDSACLEYLVASRWPNGFVCPWCQETKAWRISKPLGYECSGCGRRTSPTAGTLLHRSHLPIQEWFWAAYLVTTHTPGLSALQLQRQLGMSCYESAWFMLHRLRRAMVNDSRSKLRGSVEVDETMLGGPSTGKRGRGSSKALVFGAVEVIRYTNAMGNYGEKAGRLRLVKSVHADEESIRHFVETMVEPGSEIWTDGWRGYNQTALAGFVHEKHHPETHALHIHRAFGNLKTWLNGTHHGVDSKYLQSYLDEFVFRFNRRKTPMAAFQTLLGIAASKNPLSLDKLTQP
ncbi:MAG: IS1595 family transposase [Negativicutes bacterium]|nr:IS1595 family transposase [Negativicutes bacterium]